MGFLVKCNRSWGFISGRKAFPKSQGVAGLPDVSNSSVAAAATATAPGWGKSLAGWGAAGWGAAGVAGRTATPAWGERTAASGGMRTATLGAERTATPAWTERTATSGGMRTATLGQVQVAVQRVEEEEETDPDAESFDDW